MTQAGHQAASGSDPNGMALYAFEALFNNYLIDEANICSAFAG